MNKLWGKRLKNSSRPAARLLNSFKWIHLDSVHIFARTVCPVCTVSYCWCVSCVRVGWTHWKLSSTDHKQILQVVAMWWLNLVFFSTLQSSAGSSHVLSLPAALQKSCSSESTRVVRMKLKMLTLEKNFYGDMKIRAGKEFIWKLSSRPAEDWNVVCADHKVSLIKLPWQLRPPPVSSLPREQRNHKFVIFPPKPNLSFT